MSDKITIMDKEYCGEELGDISNDVADAVEFVDMDKIPVDEHGFQQGTFKVTITWESE